MSKQDFRYCISGVLPSTVFRFNMKIVHLCLSCFFIDNYSYQENLLPKYHVKMGHDVTVIASLVSFNKEGRSCLLEGYQEYDDKNGFHVVRLPYRKPFALNKILRKYDGLSDVLQKEKPDIIFSHGIQFADISVVDRYLCAHPNVKLYADNHGDYVNSAKNFLSKNILHPIIWRHYAKRIERQIVKCYGVTPMRCRFLKEMYHLNSSLVEFLPMGVDDEAIPKDRIKVKYDIRGELDIPKDALVVFTGGKIDKRKNTHVLIDAINLIKNNKVHLILCGVLTPEMEYLMNDIHKNKNIHYLGWCNSERVMSCMVASDLACFPGTHSTLWEQFVGVGLPSIFKKWDEMEHVNVNDNCIFVSGNDSNEIADAIKKILSNYNVYLNRSQLAGNVFRYSQIAKKAIGYD